MTYSDWRTGSLNLTPEEVDYLRRKTATMTPTTTPTATTVTSKPQSNLSVDWRNPLMPNISINWPNIPAAQIASVIGSVPSILGRAAARPETPSVAKPILKAGQVATSINPLSLQAVGKAAQVANAPIEWTGQEIFKWDDPEQRKHYDTMLQMEKEYSEELKRRGISENDPATEAERTAIAKEIVSRHPDWLPSSEILKTYKKRYAELPTGQKMLYEVPGTALLGLVTSPVSASIKGAVETGRISRTLGNVLTGALSLYDLDMSPEAQAGRLGRAKKATEAAETVAPAAEKVAKEAVTTKPVEAVAEAVVPAAEKAATAATTATKAVTIPSTQELIQRALSGKLKGLAGKVTGAPVIKQVGRLVKPTAVADDPGTVLSAVSGMIDDQVSGAVTLTMSKPRTLMANAKKLFQVNKDGIAEAPDIIQLKPLPNGQQSKAMHDLIEYAPWYDFGEGAIGEARRQAIDSIREASNEVSQMLRNENILVDAAPQPGQVLAKKGEEGWTFLHRVVTQIKEEKAEVLATRLAETLKESNINFARIPTENSYEYVARFADNVRSGAIKPNDKINELLDDFASLADVNVKRGNMAAHRKWDTVAEGLKGGAKYETDPLAELEKQIYASYDLVKRKRLAEGVQTLLRTTTPTEKAMAELGVDAAELAARKTNSGRLVNYLQRIIRGESLPGASLKVIRTQYPDLATRLDEALKLLPKQRGELIRKAQQAAINAVKVTGSDAQSIAKRAETYANIEMAFKQIGAQPEISREGIIAAIEQTIKDKAAAGEAVKAVFSDLTEKQKATLTELLAEAKKIQAADQKQWTQFRNTVQKYTERMQSSSEYGKIPGLPGLGGRYIESQGGKMGQEIADTVRRRFGYLSKDETNAFIEAVGNAGAVMRMFKLGYDLSASTIQQLLSLGYDLKNLVRGRPTAVWAKSTAGAVSSLINRRHLEGFLADNWDVAKEFIEKSGLIESAEFTEGVGVVGKAVAKLPDNKVKDVATWISKEILGRSDAVFTTGRVEAAINLYKAGRKMAENAGQLDEWAKACNRMTGAFSTRGIGVGAGQRSMESAIVFLSPRFTRANIAVLYDIIKNPGSYTAKEAAASLAALIGAWTAIYYAVNKSQGKPVTLNPFDPDFGNVYVGNRTYRFGGIMADLRRLMAAIDSGVYGATGQRISLSNKEDNTPRLDRLLLQQFQGKTAPATATGMDIYRMLSDKNATDFGGEKLSWQGIFGDWLSPAWTDPLLTGELDPWQGMAADFFGVTSGEAKPSIAKQTASESMSKLGTIDITARDKALKGVKDEAKRQEIMARDWTYDTSALRRDIADAIKNLDDADISSMGMPLVEAYARFAKEKAAYDDLSSAGKERYLAEHPDFRAAYVFWGYSTSVTDLETAIKLESMAREYGVPVAAIEAFRPTASGKPRIPPRELWETYYSYINLDKNIWSRFPPEVLELAVKVNNLENGTVEQQRQAKLLLRTSRYGPLVLRARDMIATGKLLMRRRNRNLDYYIRSYT